MKSQNEVADEAEFGLLRAYLARQGVSQQWITKHTDKDKTRSENAEMLKAAMKDLT